MALIGDTQRTLWLERLIGREDNSAERAALVRDLTSQRPDLVVLLGDMTADGGSSDDWREFDELFAPLETADVPMLALLGNHDYWGADHGALANAAARFPQLGERRWYARTFGRIGLVFLDSNRDQLGERAWTEQREWYRRTLSELDCNAAVRGVLVLTHHPPYTNSRLTRDDEDVQGAFVPAFVGARKTLAFMSGHTHAYERFEKLGRTFVVSGGGGGPRVDLVDPAVARHRDLFTSAAPRPFHYLLIEQDAGGAEVTVRGLEKGETRAWTIERFNLPFVREEMDPAAAGCEAGALKEDR